MPVVGKIALIPGMIPFDFLAPEFRSGTWPFEKVAVVTMPKAAIDQNDSPVFW